MNKKGFTLIEMMIATGMSLAILYLIIGFPTTLMKLYRAIDIDSDYYRAISNIHAGIQTDIQQNMYIHDITPTSFKVSNSTYQLKENGFYRNNKRLTNLPITFDFNNSLLRIYSLTPDKNNNVIDLYYYFNPLFSELANVVHMEGD